MMVHLKLQKPKETNYVYEEAQAMLGFAKQLLDPRNFGKSLGQTGVGTWLNSKIEQAVDVGKRRALKIIDTTIEDKKNKLSRLAVADRDMPTIIRNYIRNVLCMYIADIQQELMSDLSIRMKVLDSARVDDRSANGKSLFIARRRRKHRGVFGFIVDFLNGARCWYLYNEVPGDLSIFGKVRNPYWWIFLATKVYFGLGLQAFVFFGDGGPLTPSKTKARLGNFCRDGGLVGWSSRRWRDAVAGRLTGDGGGESVSVDSVSRWVGYAPFCLDGGLCFLASARVPSGASLQDRSGGGTPRREIDRFTSDLVG